MRLYEILKEADEIEGTTNFETNSGEDVGMLSEASKEKIKKFYNKDRSKAFRMIKGKRLNRSGAKKAVQKIKDPKAIEARNEIIKTFMSNDIQGFRKLLKNRKLVKEIVDYLELLKQLTAVKKSYFLMLEIRRNSLKRHLKI